MEPLTLIAILLLTAVSIIVYRYRHIFTLLRYRLAIKQEEKRVDNPSRQRIEMVCPKCGDAMRKGYVEIYWSEDFPPSLSYGLGQSFPLGFTNESFSRRAQGLIGHRCRKCGIIRVVS